MWTRGLGLSVFLIGCSATPSGYRDLAANYERVAYVPHPLSDGDELFAGTEVLRPDALVATVLERNPTIERARQAWNEALAAVPQATGLPDPMLGVTVAPLSLFDDDVKVGFGAELRQPLPYPGKRRLRGEVALAEAEASQEDVRTVRQRLALMATQLYYDYFLVERALAINVEHIALLEQYGETITRYLETGRAWQDDALKVEVDLAELAKERVALESQRDVIVAQLNALLHRRPSAALPAPPAELELPPAIAADQAELAELALRRRPELRALAHRERGAGSRVELAEREYYPDLTVMGSYNRMWPMVSHQFMVGVSVVLPVMRGRREAAVDAAEARVARTRAERDAATDDVLREVEVSYRRVAEADDAARLYRDRALPSARNRVDAIRLGLDAGRTTFIEVIRAERELRAMQLRYYAALADTYRRRAELAWATGEPAAEGVSP